MQRPINLEERSSLALHDYPGSSGTMAVEQVYIGRTASQVVLTCDHRSMALLQQCIDICVC